MLAFRDFVPRDDTPMLALSRRLESVQAVLARANAWIAESGVEVVNVETVLLPVAAAGRDDDDARRGSQGHYTDNLQYDLGLFEVGTTRLQVIRVWHRSRDRD